MTLSIFLTVYFLFLIVYSAIIGFAVYKVTLFAKNKDLKGYSRRITLVFLTIVLSVVALSFFIIPQYNWNDNFGYYCKRIFTQTCSCETDAALRAQCEKDKKENISKPKKSQINIFKMPQYKF